MCEQCKIVDIGRSNADCGVDQEGSECDLYSYHQNAVDTAREYGVSMARMWEVSVVFWARVAEIKKSLRAKRVTK